MTAKYVLLDDTKTSHGVVVRRIRRVSDGMLGGYVETEANLSQEGTCFLHDTSVASMAARVLDDAQVFGEVFDRAVVSGSATVRGMVFDDAHVGEQAELVGRAYGHSIVRGQARVNGETFDDAIVEGSAQVNGRAFGTAHVAGTEIVNGDRST